MKLLKYITSYNQHIKFFRASLQHYESSGEVSFNRKNTDLYHNKYIVDVNIIDISKISILIRSHSFDGNW